MDRKQFDEKVAAIKKTKQGDLPNVLTLDK